MFVFCIFLFCSHDDDGGGGGDGAISNTSAIYSISFHRICVGVYACVRVAANVHTNTPIIKSMMMDRSNRFPSFNGSGHNAAVPAIPHELCQCQIDWKRNLFVDEMRCSSAENRTRFFFVFSRWSRPHILISSNQTDNYRARENELKSGE